MGLDMYLHAYKYTSDFQDVKPNYPEEVLEAMEKNNLSLYFKSQTTSFKIGYWRKFNALHHWIVENLCEGVDDCREIHLRRENIEEILNICNEILKDHTKAQELLPCSSGFFFGSQEYDEWYFEDIKETIKIMNVALELYEKNYWIEYQASW